MFYPARMLKVTIGVHERWLYDLTKALQRQGELEIIDLKTSLGQKHSFLKQEVPRTVIERVTRLSFRIDRILEIVTDFLPGDAGLISAFSPAKDTKTQAFSEDIEALCQKAGGLLRETSPVQELYEELKQCREDQKSVSQVIGSLKHLSAIDLDTGYLSGGPYTFIITGLVYPEQHESLENLISGIPSDEVAIYTERRGEGILVFGISTRREQAALEEISRSPWFHRITLPEGYTGVPSQQILIEEGRLSELKETEERLSGMLGIQAERYHDPLLSVREELHIIRDRFEVYRKYGKEGKVLYLEGWVRQKDEKTLRGCVESVTNGEHIIFMEPAKEDDDVPVRYDNPSWLRPFELLTTTFARPRYNEIDPTPFFAPAYLLFFGLMLGDAGYGIIITLVAWLLYRGPGSRDSGVRDMSFILLCSGIADIILGTLQGGWFGDLLPRFLGITPPFVLIEPLNSPIIMFQLALLIGTIHINLGFVLALLQNIRSRHYRAAFREQVIWFIMQPAAAVLLVQFFGWMTFPSYISIIAGIGLLFGVAELFISHGPMGFFSLTGFLGDWLSYVRILALALATGGIAMTINILAEMIAAPHPLMIVPAILFCIGGQIFNLAIQTLGSVIHALRLHYIEFFGKFYIGGGKEFSPFRENRIYTRELREEMV